MNLSIEGLRFTAAFGIVWFHMQAPGQPFAYSALAVFLVLTADLSAGSLQRWGIRIFCAAECRAYFFLGLHSLGSTSLFRARVARHGLNMQQIGAVY